MKQLVNIREANQHLSRYIDAVEQGAEIIITRRGLPVARLIGFEKSMQLNERQRLARNRSLARMQKGYSLGGEMPRREDLHAR